RDGASPRCSYPLDVSEVTLIQFTEPAELGIGQQHVRVAHRRSPLPQLFQLIDVFVHQQIGRLVEPFFQGARRGGQGKEDDEEESDRRAGGTHACAFWTSSGSLATAS